MNFKTIFGTEDINEKIISLVKKTPFLAVSLIIHLGILVVLMSIKLYEEEKKAKNIAHFEATIEQTEDNSPQNSLINEISEQEIEQAQSQKFETHHEMLNMDFSRVEKGKSFDNLAISKESPIPCVNVACEESDHNESANDDPIHNTIKGEGLMYGGRMPIKGKGSTPGQGGEGTGTLDVIGLGGGSGGFSAGMFGYRFGGKKNLIARAGGDPTKVETLVVNALKWLARHQHKDGYWDGMQFSSSCGGARCSDPAQTDIHNVGLTGLALLAFLGYGITPQVTINQHVWKNDDKDKYIYVDKFTNKKVNATEVVKKGLLWLKENQTEKGCYVKGYELSNHYMYDHSIATLAMAEACGLTENRVWCESAKKGAEFLVRAKRAYEGWRYIEQPQDWDVSVTGWAIMALKSARGAQINVRNEIFETVFEKLDKRMTVDDGTYRVTYDENGAFTSCYESGINCNYGGEYSMTAVGMLIRMLVNPPSKSTENNESYKILKKQAEQLMLDMPTTDIVRKDNKNPRDYYYWYYATLPLYLLDGPEGFSDGKLGYWQKWNKSIINTLVKLQEGDTKACSFGSFPAKNDKWGLYAGRVYATALNTLTMEVYFRYKNVFKFMLSEVTKEKENKSNKKDK